MWYECARCIKIPWKVVLSQLAYDVIFKIGKNSSSPFSVYPQAKIFCAAVLCVEVWNEKFQLPIIVCIYSGFRDISVNIQSSISSIITSVWHNIVFLPLWSSLDIRMFEVAKLTTILNLLLFLRAQRHIMNPDFLPRFLPHFLTNWGKGLSET